MKGVYWENLDRVGGIDRSEPLQFVAHKIGDGKGEQDQQRIGEDQ